MCEHDIRHNFASEATLGKVVNILIPLDDPRGSSIKKLMLFIADSLFF